MITYSHSGDAGDLIAGLPVIRHLGAGVLYLRASSYTRVMLSPENWRGLDRIIKAQPYIHDVLEWRNHKVAYNLDDWRARLFKSVRAGKDRDKSLLSWQLEQFGVPESAALEPWIKVEPKKIARVVFNRTGPGRLPQHTYQNSRFPWHYVWEKYRKNAVFVGLPEEHRIFCATCGAIPHVQTRDLFEVAQVIAGCDLFVGNQSVAFWIAEGLKKRVILEVWMHGQNSNIFRDGAVQGYDETVQLPNL